MKAKAQLKSSQVTDCYINLHQTSKNDFKLWKYWLCSFSFLRLLSLTGRKNFHFTDQHIEIYNIIWTWYNHIWVRMPSGKCTRQKIIPFRGYIYHVTAFFFFVFFVLSISSIRGADIRHSSQHKHTNKQHEQQQNTVYNIFL